MAINPSGLEVLEELARISRSSPELQAEVIQFLEELPSLGTLKADEAATMQAGHIVISYEPSERLASKLAALRASHVEVDAVA